MKGILKLKPFKIITMSQNQSDEPVLSKDELFNHQKARVNIIAFIEDNLKKLEDSNEEEKKQIAFELKVFVRSHQTATGVWKNIANKIKNKLPDISKSYNFYSYA